MATTAPRYIDQQVAAAILGVTDRRVRQMTQEDDALPVDTTGRVPCEAFGEWLKRRALKGVHVGDDGQTYDFEAERARLTKNQADKAELEVAELKAHLVSTDLVDAHWEAMVAAMRARLLTIPTRLAPQLAAPGQVMAVQSAIRSAVHEALLEISGDAFPELVRKRMEAAAEPARGKAAAGADGKRVGRPRKSPEPGSKRRARKVADE